MQCSVPRFCAHRVGRATLVLLLGVTLAPASGLARLEFDPQAIEEWADGYFEPRIASGLFNGASFGLIQDGETRFLKGYGSEDLAAGTPLDPTSTLIRMCSISKTFTATALLQLRDRGLIESLDNPVNRYLKRYQLPPPLGPEVTIRQLMTHSSGMAGHFTPQGTTRDLQVPVSTETVAEMFRENIERVPGTIGQYANLGVALESVLIEDITGQSMADYMARAIIAPLNMGHTMLHHETAIPEHLAQPYGRFPNGELQAVPFFPKHPLTAASGGIIATPEDMLRYAAMHADVAGTTHGAVLSARSRQEMQQVHFRNHAAGEGIGLHFYPARYGSERYVSHGCGLPGTQSELGVFPDSNAALVVSVLRGSYRPSLGDALGSLVGRGRLIAPAERTDPPTFENNQPARAFLMALVGDRQRPTVSDQLSDGAIDDLATIAGSYWTERRSRGSFATLVAAGSVLEIEQVAPNGLRFRDEKLTQVGPGVFDTSDGNRFIFRNPPGSDAIYLHTSPSSAWRQVSGLGNPKVASRLLLAGLLIQLSVFASLWWFRTTRVARWLRANGLLLAATFLLLPVVAFAGYDSMSDIAFLDAANGEIGRLILVIILLNLVGLSGVGFVIGAIPAWRTPLPAGWRAIAWRCQVTTLAVGAILTWPAFWLFNLIGVQT